MFKRFDYSAFATSVVLHGVLLLVLWMVRMNLDRQQEIALETVFAEERVQEQFSRELEVEQEIAETMNTVSGGTVSTNVGSAPQPTASQAKVASSATLNDPELNVEVADVSLPGTGTLSEDLGAGEVTGDIGAVVEGYGAALGRMAQELIRLMRSDPLLVVWLFDESESMKDDQKEIREKFYKVYEELGLARDREALQEEAGREVLRTVIWSFGQGVHPLTEQPTAEIQEIRAAIDRIPVDESGKENMCQSIIAAVREYRTLAAKQKRKLVVIVVSDESGDDGLMVEDALNQAKQAEAPIYVLGREAVFGYPFARIRWEDQYGLPHWLDIRRGPETAAPEALQWDGLRRRHDSFSSGFGPYEQVRLAKESGGIFFMLPSETEENLAGAGANMQRRFDFLAMKEYEPLLLSRRDYAQQVTGSRFRKTIREVIVMFNPNEIELLPSHDPKLNIREHHYSINPNVFRKQAAQEVPKAVRAMSLISRALPLLEEIEPLRAREESQRWRAHYDLIRAQLRSYRVRLFQFLLAVDQHVHNMPTPEDPKTNRWNVHRRPKMILPDDAQFQRIKQSLDVDQSKEDYLATLKKQEEEARRLYQAVIETHPGTPWAQRARYELDHGFGMHFVEHFHDPRYNNPDVQTPNL